MNTELLSARFAPLASWLILTASIVLLLPIKLELSLLLIVIVGVTALALFSCRNAAAIALSLIYASVLAFALRLPLPWPGSWPPFAQLLATVSSWSLVLLACLAMFVGRSFRAARSDQ